MMLAKMVDMESVEDVLFEVKLTTLLMFPAFDFSPVERACRDVERLFQGKYPGYRACNTSYHDIQHTMDAFLAMVRFMHGAFVAGKRLDERQTRLGLVSALMHDTGYIQTVDDRTGTGGKYTLSHVARSIDFLDGYFSRNGYDRSDFLLCRKVLKCTGLDVRISEIVFDTPEEAMLGKMLGAADLFGQLADSCYLGKLASLYQEFREGNVPGYADQLELFEKTPMFYEFTLQRMEKDLGGVHRYLKHHFAVRWNVERDLYLEAIERNIGRLKDTIESYRQVCSDRELMGVLLARELEGTCTAGLSGLSGLGANGLALRLS